MYDVDFEELVKSPAMPIWVKNLYEEYKQTGNKSLVQKILEGIRNTVDEFNTNAINGVYNQSFILTATGDSLDRYGAIFDVKRNGLNDDDYRNVILGKLHTVENGSTILTIRLILEQLGYVIDRWEKNCDKAFYTDDTGGRDNAYTGYDDTSGVVGEENWINYTIYFYLTPTPTQSEIAMLEELINGIKKVYNRVYIR
jgi:hypothetical protein